MVCKDRPMMGSRYFECIFAKTHLQDVFNIKTRHFENVLCPLGLVKNHEIWPMSCKGRMLHQVSAFRCTEIRIEAGFLQIFVRISPLLFIFLKINRVILIKEG